MDARPNSGRLVDGAMYKTRYQACLDYEVAERFTALCSPPCARDIGHHPVAVAVAARSASAREGQHLLHRLTCAARGCPAPRCIGRASPVRLLWEHIEPRAP